MTTPISAHAHLSSRSCQLAREIATICHDIFGPDPSAHCQGTIVEVIPVIDLKDGVVVHARMGLRSAYAPIETRLSPTSRPDDVARGLLSIFPFKTFYVADLDAIEHRGDNSAALRQLSAEYPNLVFWVDAGIADVHHAARWLEAGFGHLVVGSETQRDCELIRYLCRNDRTILSLDFRGDAFLGPDALLNEADIWPI